MDQAKIMVDRIDQLERKLELKHLRKHFVTESLKVLENTV